MVRKESVSSGTPDRNFEDLDDPLDFEVEESEEATPSCKIADSEDNSPNNKFSYIKTYDISSPAHTREMLPILKDNSADNRKEEYIKMGKSSVSSQTVLDSSSDDSVTESDLMMDDESDNSSLHMSPDEENKYLASDNEEDEYAVPGVKSYFHNKLVSQTGDLITITCSNKEKETNLTETALINTEKDDYSVTDSVETIPKCFILKRGKKRKIQKSNVLKRPSWDLSVITYCEADQLFLNDIGYQDVSSEDDDSDKDSQKVTTFKITCRDNQPRICEQMEEPVSDTGSLDSIFKVPLPPVKRPPTRPKKSEGKEDALLPIDLRHSLSNRDIFQNKQKSLSESLSTTSSLREDDEISIAASSIAGIENNNLENADVHLEHTASEFNLTQSTQNFDDSMRRETLTRNWLEHHVTPPEQNTEENIFHPPVDTTGVPRVNFKYIPPFFTGLCYYYYFNNHCARHNCRNSHSVIVDKFTARARNISNEDMMKSYSFMMPFKKLYQDIYLSFINAFSEKNMQYEMVDCIKHFFDKEVDIPFAVGVIVDNLEKNNGMKLTEAVEFISYRIGLMQYPILADILMDLLSKNFDINSTWGVIKKILMARGAIPPTTVIRIINRATSVFPMDKHLCLDIYNVIITNKKTDLSLINENVLVPLKTLVSFNQSPNTGQPPSSSMFAPKSTVNPAEDLTDIIDRQLLRERTRFEAHMKPTNRTVNLVTKKITIPSDDSSYYDKSNTSRCSSPSFMSESLCNAPYVPQHVSPNRRINMDSLNKKIELFPKKPIVGKTVYGSNFKLDSSLHHLFTQTPRHQVSINERDIIKLNNAIQNGDGETFLLLLERNKNAATIQNFVSMTIADLKSYKNLLIDGIKNLINSVAECKPDYDSDLHIKVVFEAIVMNILLELENHIQWEEGKFLIEKFCDWDSLVSAQIFGARKISHMGRYILLAKILAKGKNLVYSYDILNCPELHLLESPEMWPYFYHDQDLRFRNSILNDIFKTGYNYNIAIVLELYKKNIFNFESKHFDSMMVSLIDQNKITILSGIYGSIDNMYMKMQKDALRAFTLLLIPGLDLKDKIKLYELCCEKQIFKKFSGMEAKIIVRTNMPNEEIELIFIYFFLKLVQLESYIYTNVIIEICLPELNQHCTIKYLKSMVRCVRDVNVSIRTILEGTFKIQTVIDENNKLTEITIPANQIMLYVRRNQKT